MHINAQSFVNVTSYSSIYIPDISSKIIVY